MKEKLAIVACVILLTACTGTSVRAKTVLKETDCKTHVLLSALENDAALVDLVLDGKIDLKDALAIVSAVDEQVPVVQAQLKACQEIVEAPPPAPGDKVM